MGKPPCRDGSTPPLRPLPSLSSLRSLPAPTHTLRQRGRRGQLLAVGANAMGLAQSVGLLLSDDSSSRLILKINASKLLAVAIAHDAAGVVEFFEGPRRRKRRLLW